MKVGYRPDLTHRTMTERVDLQKRLKRCQKKIVQIMPYLGKIIRGPITKQKLLDFIQFVNAPMLKKLDRMAMRQKPALICWLSENWDSFEHAFNQTPEPKPVIEKKPVIEADIDSIFTKIDSEPVLLIDYSMPGGLQCVL
ncbi:hypothetical protein TVAG_441930 [Trichomonas vaginalis G3]|uniref:Uncharacterized protein n=1 Tax=Trichomonas vaginalis (strain ATCC PRA-98 / G3) TaxID=412133 RepID=A2G768_TRIV3|nr:hypothetical protein TVAGG3_0308990 [Trichomonas vaginalis G3]EAX86995.1 hypothetical protein TVAG_441930 [Trichomonas vaginalis G3]KAI5528449.1 hypothetical protein TVAGG3_0308990 [Trichomonas vaginalis G3]|eukprot:XP_001299925.1 hypothetical protein [Trichomonas vaginalis G3]